MRRRSIVLAIAIVAIIAAAITWEIASPLWTLKNMRDAARARDSERLASYVDFPRVRAGLHDQLIDAADKRIPISAIQAIVGKRAVDRVVDRAIKVIVSPEGLGLALDVAAQGKGANGEDSDAARNSCGMTRESLDRFRVRCAQLPTGRGDLVFEREGLGWRLVGIDLPDGDADAAS